MIVPEKGATMIGLIVLGAAIFLVVRHRRRRRTAEILALVDRRILDVMAGIHHHGNPQRTG